MIGIFNTITIAGVEFPRPSDFEIQREDVLAGEYTTCTGKIIADRIGWRYSDMTLRWDSLTQDQLATLTAISGSVPLTFTDSDGEHTEEIIRLGFTNTPTRFTGPGGVAIWKGVGLEVRFINVHND